jgi:hypothetical protein
MSSHDPFNADLHRLLCRLSDGEATPDLLQQIEALVLADPQAKRQYLQYMQFESAAEQMLASDQSSTAIDPTFFEPSATLSQAPRSGELSGARASLMPISVDDALTNTINTAGEGEARTVRVAHAAKQSGLRWLLAFGGAVAVLLGGVLLGQLGGGITPVSTAPGAHAVATLVGTQDCRWLDSEHAASQFAPGARLPVGKLQLAEGLAELVFDCGAQVILEGPAEFELTGVKSAIAWQGRLVAKVPPAATGFTVTTPDAKVIDHGTEFALSVEHSKSTEVHVIAGRVEVEPATDSARGAAVAKELLSGQAVRLDRASQGLPQEVELAQNRFVRNVRFGYGLYPPSLISYWSFDETLEGGRAMDRAGSNHGSFEGQVKRVSGLVGQGSAMFTNTQGDLVNVGPDFSFTTGITIEALVACHWDGQFDAKAVDVYPDRGNYDEIFRKEDGDQRVLLSFQHDDMTKAKAIPVVPAGPVLSFGLNIAGEYTELDMPLDGQEGRPTVAELCDGKMHHIAATYDSATGEKAIYIDGTTRFSTRFHVGALIESGGNVSAGLGGWYGEWASGETFGPTEPFTGAIDEVAVYRAALSEHDIANHYQRVVEGRNYFFDALPQFRAASAESTAADGEAVPPDRSPPSAD